MRLRRIRQSIWPVSVFGLGFLLLVIALAGVADLQQIKHIYASRPELAALGHLQREMGYNLLTALFVGLCIAAGSLFRISELEQESARQQLATKRAEEQLRQLSQQLVSTQEQERKRLSRELHDEIGQSLSALLLELGRLQRSGHAPGLDIHVNESKKLTERTLQAVRSISMGLRPAMLDELGLGPALEWQVREFSARFQIKVDLQLASDLRQLPDPHRTYLYRIIQECLTNCARHSRAQEIHIRVFETRDALSAVVKDDGIGFNARNPAQKGLGLLGISERIRELGGHLEIQSEQGKGTEVRVTLPTLDGATAEQSSIVS